MIVLAVLGCVPLAPYQRAQTLGYGNWELGVETSGIGHIAERGGQGSPGLDVAFRYGLGEQTDLGVRAGSSGVELGMKLGFTDPRYADVSVSMAPSASGAFVDTEELSTAYGAFHAPVLVGIPLVEGHELQVGGGLLTHLQGRPRDHDTLWSLGATAAVGYAWEATHDVTLLPQLAFYLPFVRSGDTTLGGPGAAELAMSGGIAVLVAPSPW
ncbi:MAG: hypothetical protein FJ102_25890 [Deltaproteobacteria bacterium]|nr:hypothetical protein [Deltaproteobacteria bacterium]